MPGTHDTKLLIKCIKKLKKKNFKKFLFQNLINLLMIDFQKKMAKSKKKPDIVIFEGMVCWSNTTKK